MRNVVALSFPLRQLELLWPALFGELGLLCLLLSAGGLPEAAVRALQLFLRF